LLASDEHGNLLMGDIITQIKAQNSRKIIVSASAASNVTSKITDLMALNSVISKNKFYLE
jgi:selenocysteine lyase/cysteine desulfurase